MHANFMVIANGANITHLIQDRLLSLTVTDEAGIGSDTVELVVDDRGYRVTLPPVGATLDVFMASGFNLARMGRFTVDDAGGSGPVADLTISGKAVDMTGGARSSKTRSWEDITLEDLTAEVAGDNSMGSQVHPDLASHHYDYVAQTAESDLNLMTRLAQDIDGLFKAAGGQFLITKRGSGETASGVPIPPTLIPITDMSDWTWNLTSRGRSGKVTALWTEQDTATTHRVSVGDGEPERVLRHRFPNEAQAERAAQAELDRGARASGKFSANLAVFRPGLMAEAPIIPVGVKPEASGQWILTSVTHRLENNGVRTSFNAERDNEAAETEAL